MINNHHNDNLVQDQLNRNGFTKSRGRQGLCSFSDVRVTQFCRIRNVRHFHSQVDSQTNPLKMSTVGIANYELVEAGVNDESKAAKVQVEKPVKVSSIQSSMNLTWEKIHYAVSIKDPETKGAMKQKIILHSMSGKAIPGEILGIMGSSGAGEFFSLYISEYATL